MPQRVARRTARPSGFDFTRHMRAVCEDMLACLPELAHIDLTRVAISFSQARHSGCYGLYASLTPLRPKLQAISAEEAPRLEDAGSLPVGESGDRPANPPSAATHNGPPTLDAARAGRYRRGHGSR